MTTLPVIQGLCPLLQVFDMPRSLAFYRKLLGFEIAQQAPAGVGDQADWVWLKRGNAELMLNTMFEYHHRPATAPAQRQASHNDTTLYIGAPDLDAMHAWLKSNGLALHPPVIREYGMRQLSLTDPDGYGICFQWPCRE